MELFKKALRELGRQYRSRGLVGMFVLNKVQFAALFRALWLKLLYTRKLDSSVFFVQANSSLELLSRHARMRIGKFVFIRKNTSIRIDHEGELVLGDYVFINDNCNINCVGRLSIGAYTKIAPNVCINDHDHNYKSEGRGHLLVDDVTIGEHVWIGSNVVILRGTIIGDYAVIAAGSVVKGTVPANTVFMNKRENRMLDIMNHAAQQPVKATI
jgi:acetyltransferase-like isoleucine patch superfamily enzyme